MKKYLLFILFMACFFMLSCNSIQGNIKKLTGEQAREEQKVAELRADFASQISAKENEIKAAREAVISAKNAQIVGAGNAFYAQDMVFKTIPAPIRTDLVNHNFTLEGWAALGNIMPDYNTVVAINERLKKELDESKTSIADLQKNHQIVMLQNEKLEDDVKKMQDNIAALEKEKVQLNETFKKQLDEKQINLIKLGNEIAGLEKQRADDKVAINAMKMKISLIAGGLALAALAGAIYSPIGKGSLGLFAGICSLVSVGIWYVQPWHVALFAALVVVGTVITILRKYHISDKANDAFINFLHDKEQNSKEVYNQHIKPDLDAWITKYSKDKNGNIVSVPDTTIQALIDQKLISSNRK